MRSIMPVAVPPPPARPQPALSGPEVLIVVVIMVLAAALVVAGQAMAATLEFLGGAVFLACRTVTGLRRPQGHPGQRI
jgi:hypothetical protein